MLKLLDKTGSVIDSDVISVGEIHSIVKVIRNFTDEEGQFTCQTENQQKKVFQTKVKYKNILNQSDAISQCFFLFRKPL